MLPKNPEQIEEILRPLRLEHGAYEELMRRMNEDMVNGLSTDNNMAADLKMYITYVRSVPDGTECGNFLALDLGGTNFRVLRIRLNQQGEVEMENTIYMIPESIMVGHGNQLFDHIASCIESFVTAQNMDRSVELPLGFTFSFPCKQEGLDKARLVTWTKGFKCEGVEGEDIVRLLHEAAARRNLKIRCTAVINDTVGALMSCAHEDKNCQIGLILGTGTNACYMERLDKVKQWDADAEDPRETRVLGDEVIINTEWGAFGHRKNGVSALDFLTTEYDRNVDNMSINPEKQIYEKMISGMYMGEIARQVIVKLVEIGSLFGGFSSDKLKTPMAFLTKYISEIESDGEFSTYENTRQVLDELDIPVTCYRLVDCLVLQEVCTVVSTRAAYLAAAGIAVLLQRVSKPAVTVGVDGSLYRYHPRFHQLITEKITQLAPNKQFKLMLSSDGSGKGAALVAAVSWRLKTAAQEEE